MKNYATISVLFATFIAAVTSINVQTTVYDGASSLIGDSIGESFKKIGDHYYLIEPTLKKTWFGAVHFCRTKGAHLASFETAEEWQTLSSHLVSQGYTDSQWFWIAGNDIDEPLKFFWISNGKPMSVTKWIANQPDNSAENERCVHLRHVDNDFLMNDLPCNKTLHYICQINGAKTVSMTIW